MDHNQIFKSQKLVCATDYSGALSHGLWPISECFYLLSIISTEWICRGQINMAGMLQMEFLNLFPWLEKFIFWPTFHWNESALLLLMVCYLFSTKVLPEPIRTQSIDNIWCYLATMSSWQIRHYSYDIWKALKLFNSTCAWCLIIIIKMNLGAVSIRKTVLPGMAIPMLKIRRPNGHLIFNMEIAIRR